MTSITVTNSGAGSYTINGQLNNPTITLVRGNTYNLEINASGHPFWIQTVPGGFSTNDKYTPGVSSLSTNGIQIGTIIFVVPLNAPDRLYYACGLHSSMQGTIIIIDSVSTTIPSMSSLFTNNAQVYYKLNSLSTGAGGSGVKNHRSKQRRT